MSTHFRSHFTVKGVHNAAVIIRGKRLGVAGLGLVAIIAMGSAPSSAVGRTGLAPARAAERALPAALVTATKVKPQPAPNEASRVKRPAKLSAFELRTAIDSWHVTNKAYKAAAATRALAVIAINETFTASVRRAKADFDVTRAHANTPAAKSAAAARFADAVSIASAVRQAALDALPPLPPAPGPRPTAKRVAALKHQARSAANPFVG